LGVGRLRETAVKKGLPPARTALAHLQRADAAFREVQVSQRNQSGGGGGSQAANELNNLFKLEMDKFRSQYAHVKRGNHNQQQQQVDEVTRRLKELAERQQCELQRNAGNNAGDNQRALAAAVEDLIRRLQQLTAKREDTAVAQALEQLRNAAQAMRAANDAGSGQASRQQAQADTRAAQKRPDTPSQGAASDASPAPAGGQNRKPGSPGRSGAVALKRKAKHKPVRRQRRATQPQQPSRTLAWRKTILASLTLAATIKSPRRTGRAHRLTQNKPDSRRAERHCKRYATLSRY
jgi:hypothetical protein